MTKQQKQQQDQVNDSDTRVKTRKIRH